MGKPTPETFVRANGRRGTVIWSAQWTQTDSDDYITATPILSLTDMSGDYEDVAGGRKARLAVEKVQWAGSLNVMGVLYFDSMPPGPDSNILVIPPDASSGELDFSSFPSGNLPDPVPVSPGDIVLSTEGALPGDRLVLTLWFKEKGRIVNV